MPASTDFQAAIGRAADLIADAHALVVAAGAGMGIDSGLPDFRGPGGFWGVYPALGRRGLHFAEVASPHTFVTDPALAWGFYGHRLALYRRTAPHAGIRVAPRLGVGNDIRWKPKDVWAGYPFPHDDTGLTPELSTRIRALAEQLDAHRKAQQAAQPEPRAAAVETLLERLVALNARRAAEEAAGTVRWLRPDFQSKSTSSQAALEGMAEVETEDTPSPAAPAAPAAPLVKTPWPVGLPEQIKAVAEVLATHGRALSLADLEARFTARGRWRDRLPTIIDTLEALGRARRVGDEAARWQAG